MAHLCCDDPFFLIVVDCSVASDEVRVDQSDVVMDLRPEMPVPNAYIARHAKRESRCYIDPSSLILFSFQLVYRVTVLTTSVSNNSTKKKYEYDI